MLSRLFEILVCKNLFRAGESPGKFIDRCGQDRTTCLWAGQPDGFDQVRTGKERSVNGFGEVARRNEQQMWVVCSKLIELSQHSVCRSMHIDRIGVHAHARAIGCERFDFIEQHD